MIFIENFPFLPFSAQPRNQPAFPLFPLSHLLSFFFSAWSLVAQSPRPPFLPPFCERLPLRTGPVPRASFPPLRTRAQPSLVDRSASAFARTRRPFSLHSLRGWPTCQRPCFPFLSSSPCFLSSSALSFSSRRPCAESRRPHTEGDPSCLLPFLFPLTIWPIKPRDPFFRPPSPFSPTAARARTARRRNTPTSALTSTPTCPRNPSYSPAPVGTAYSSF